MSSILRSVVIGVGGYLPEECVTNDDLAKFVDTNDEWIVERTGIRTRHRAAPEQGTSDLAVEAAKKALASAGRTADQVRLVAGELERRGEFVERLLPRTDDHRIDRQ